MNSIRTFVNRYTLATFFVLAYLLSWWINLLEWHSMFPLGPLLSAMIVLALTSGKSGVGEFFKRIVQWRVGMPWYLLVLLLPLTLMSVAIGVNMWLGMRSAGPFTLPSVGDFVVTLLVIMLYIGLGEEPAWRGFALPRLMVGRTALGASLLLALFHALWHLPLFGLEYDLQTGVPWFVLVCASAIVFSWIYQNTQGSLLLPILMHTSQNISGQFLMRTFVPAAYIVQTYWILAALWVIVAGVIIFATGPNLVRRNTPKVTLSYAGQPITVK